jgi:hypothetical protein
MPSVSIAEASGLLAPPPQIDNTALVVGTAQKGTSAALGPLYGDPTALYADYGEGPLSTDAGASIKLNQTPGLAMQGQQPSPACYVYRTPGTTAGACGTAVTSGMSGTASAHATVTGAAYNDFDVYVIATSAITVGTSGKFKYSLDGGRTLSAEINLGTATSYVIPNSNVTIGFGSAADTWVLGDVLTCPTSAPKWGTTDLDNFFTNYANSGIDVGIIYICGPMSATEFGHVVTGLATMAAQGKRPYVIVNARVPNFATPESDATWMASIETDFASATSAGPPGTDATTICAGYGWFTDPNAGRIYRRNMGASYLAKVVGSARSVSPSWVQPGPLPNLSLVDGNGNLIGHDENVAGGLDAMHFVTTYRVPNPQLRTGCYVYRPWTFYQSGSKVTLVPFRRLANAIERVVSAVSWQNIGNKVFYDPTTLALSTADQGAIASTVKEVLALNFKITEIINLENDDPAPAPPLVQVASAVTVNAGLVSVPVTINPHPAGVIDSFSITLSLQV